MSKIWKKNSFSRFFSYLEKKLPDIPFFSPFFFPKKYWNVSELDIFASGEFHEKWQNTSVYWYISPITSKLWKLWKKRSPIRMSHLFCRSFVSIYLLFRHREACCFEDSHDDCHHFREPFRRLRDNSCIIGVQDAPYRALRTHANGSCFSVRSKQHGGLRFWRYCLL